MDELVSKPPGVSDDMRLRQLNFEDFWEDNDFDVFTSSSDQAPTGSPILSSMGEYPSSDMLQMRRVVQASRMLITSTNLDSSRQGPCSLQSMGLACNPDDPGWLTLVQGLRIELVVRAVSPLTGAELCLCTARAPWENAASANGNTANRRTQQQASMVVKIIRIESDRDPEFVSLMNQLQTLSRSEHKNILPIKKIHVAKPSDSTTLVVIAYERCSTSLYTTVADGYRSRVGGGALVSPRGLAGRMNPGLRKPFPPTSAGVGKIGELLTAVQRFHSLGMVHGRICPSNIFIDADAALKLGDFDSKLGLAKNEELIPDSVSCWMGHDMELSKQNDVFSAGMCIFLSLTGQHPFATFADEDRTGAAGAANSVAGGNGLFIESISQLRSNMKNLDSINQHLLYNCPLALDLVSRMIIGRTDVGDLLTHPMFWDFYAAARFITRLPIEVGSDERTGCSPRKGENRTAGPLPGRSVAYEFCASCPVPWTAGVLTEEWKLISLNATPMDFKDSVADCLLAIRMALAKHKTSGCPMCTTSEEGKDFELATMQHTAITEFVCRILARFPAVAVRAWDAGRIAAKFTDPVGFDKSVIAPLINRNHLAWMGIGSAVSVCSHEFVREYYKAVAVSLGEMSGKEFKSGRDESEDIVMAIQRGTAVPPHSPSLTAPSVPTDPQVIASMVNSFSAMVRSDMLPPGIPKQFVYSLIEAQQHMQSPPMHPASSPAAGVYYSTVKPSMQPPSLQLPSGATTAATNSPAFVTVMSPRESPRNRRMSSCDGWEYAVACPPTMLDLRHSASLVHADGDEDESPPPGFQAVWQSMADDGL
jgi:serine/threonine protein kinase